MTARELLMLLGQVLLVLLTLWKLADLARHRDRARLDIALVLGSLAVAVAVQRLQGDDAVDLGAAQRAGPLALVAHPFLLLRLVGHFHAVPRWLTGAVLLGLLGSWAILIFDAPSPSLPGTLALVAYVALATLYCARLLVEGARRAQGVVRRRIGLVAAGALLFALLAALSGLEARQLGGGDLGRGLTEVTTLGVALCYFLGFAPPLWLARAWQLTELQEFIRASAGAPGEATEVALKRLCQMARHSVGGLAAAVARWEEGAGRLELVTRGERALVGGPLPADSLVASQWTFRRPFVANNRREVREACRRLAPGLDCDTLLGVPLLTRTRAWGLLLVFLRRSPLFPDEDLRLLTLFAEHSAVALDNAAVIEQLRRENAALRGEPVADPQDEADLS